jgi:short-subunit dehydrogenase
MSRGAALITGASSGIGAELARLCAAGGYDLILVARGVGRMNELAAEFTRSHKISARPLAADLADSSAPEAIFDQTRGDTIEILINNAGFGMHGLYAETDWDQTARMIQVNVTALAHLTRLYLPEMLRRRSGRILNIASTAGMVPGPLMAAYYASKAFVISLSEAIANEVKGSGVTVTVLCPGPTNTGFASAAGVTESNLFRGATMSAEAVAREGYRAMMAGKAEHVAGTRNRWMMRGTRMAPRMMVAQIVRGLNSKR